MSWVSGTSSATTGTRSQRKELVILMKAELVPTLQERITQKTKEDGVFEQWLQQQER